MEKENVYGSDFEAFDAQDTREKRSRIRYANFQRVESTQHRWPLTPFELEVLDKIASAPSPMDELIRSEEKEEKREWKRAAKWMLAALLKKIECSQMERTCFELAYRKKWKVRKIAEHLKTSRGAVRVHLYNIRKILKRAAKTKGR